MKTYTGTRVDNGVIVTVNKQPLRPRLDLRNHSPDGFEWGYSGSSPAQLALAILADHLDGEAALAIYQEFKWWVVANFPHDNWSLTSEQIDEQLRLMEKTTGLKF